MITDVSCIAVDRPTIWYSPSRKCWWMEHRDPLVARAMLAHVDDAIDVTNALDVLQPEFIAALRKGAGRA